MKPVLITACILTVLLMPAVGGAQAIHKIANEKEGIMTVHQNNKETVRKLYEQGLNKRNMDLLEEIVSDDYAGPGGLKGRAGFEAPVAELIRAFPDMQWHIEELVGDDNKVAVRWKLQGTHKYRFQDFEATGKAISSGGVAIYEFKDGKITAVNVLTDRLGFLQQLDVLPAKIYAVKANSTQVNFIDKFFVPAAAKDTFLQRMRYNRKFIRALPGFVKDEAFEQADANGNITCITVATWESQAVLDKAKEAVLAEYKRIGFNPADFYQQLKIKLERQQYRPVTE